MSRRTRLALAGLALLAAAPALAQGTPEQRQACTPDVMRLCGAAVPDVPQIVACLRRERPQVSPACQQAMRDGETTEVAASGVGPRRAVR
jgi:hypothetical protein